MKPKLGIGGIRDRDYNYIEEFIPIFMVFYLCFHKKKECKMKPKLGIGGIKDRDYNYIEEFIPIFRVFTLFIIIRYLNYSKKK